MLYNWNIVGHEETLKLLELDIKNNNVSQCYLFVGPNQLGKFTVAHKMANILQCENNYCHQCSVCVEIKKEIHPDTTLIKNDGESLKIDLVREVINKVNMTPQSKHNIVLIESIERLTPEAANALLKTLEEPAPDVVFLLTTDNIKAILPTILSRSRIVNFHLCSEPLIMKYLEERHTTEDAETLKQAGLLSLGKPGKAIAFLEDRSLLSYFQALYNDASSMFLEESVTRKFQYVESLLEKEFMAQDFLDVMEHVARTRLLDFALQTNKNQASQQQLMALIKEIQQVRDYLNGNINSKLALENLLLAI